jgi:hypothetical protein
MITNPTGNNVYRSCFNLQGNPSNTLALSAWRTAFAAVLFEKDKSKINLAISNAQAAITERLNGSVQISGLENKSIAAAQDALCGLSVKARVTEESRE